MWMYNNGDIVAEMKTTNGMIKILLETELAPRTTTNFIALAKKGYYNGIIFHRVIKWFMIQGWDPTGTWMWWESIYGEKFDDEFHPELQNNKYTISMANAWPNTNGSQFFINVADNNYLDNKHSVFGEVVEWIDNVDKIAKTKTNSADKPEKEVKIISLEIKECKNGQLVEYIFDLDSALEKQSEELKKKREEKRAKKIAAWDKIAVHYTWLFKDGTIFDSSLDRAPIEFEVGSGMMIKWFDEWVVGMQIGEKKSLELSPEQAYGEKDEAKVQVMNKADLKSFTDAWCKLEVGEKLPTQMGELEIIQVDGDNITIDINHPLAGKTLLFDIEIVDIN